MWHGVIETIENVGYIIDGVFVFILSWIWRIVLIIISLFILSIIGFLLIPESGPEIGPSAVELSDFSGDGYSLTDMTAEYGSCYDREEFCIRLAYTLNCGKQRCKVCHYHHIIDDDIYIEAYKEGCRVQPEAWFNRHESVNQRALKRGESHTEIVVFKLDKPEPGGVTITVDGQTVYQD